MVISKYISSRCTGNSSLRISETMLRYISFVDLRGRPDITRIVKTPWVLQLKREIFHSQKHTTQFVLLFFDVCLVPKYLKHVNRITREDEFVCLESKYVYSWVVLLMSRSPTFQVTWKVGDLESRNNFYFLFIALLNQKYNFIRVKIIFMKNKTYSTFSMRNECRLHWHVKVFAKIYSETPEHFEITMRINQVSIWKNICCQKIFLIQLFWQCFHTVG